MLITPQERNKFEDLMSFLLFAKMRLLSDFDINKAINGYIIEKNGLKVSVRSNNTWSADLVYKIINLHEEKGVSYRDIAANMNKSYYSLLNAIYRYTRPFYNAKRKH